MNASLIEPRTSILSESEYRKKVIGCWRGKAAGGTLGMTTEGIVGRTDLTFYDPVPTELLPNDDLELQVLWCCALAAMNPPVVNRKNLAMFWLEHNYYPCDEYSIATRNLQWGIMPPESGHFGNFFVDGLGAAIRSEIWACLAPGEPALAAKYAYEDACIDHAGDGIYAEQFCAALESAAFSNTNLISIIDEALEVIPNDCRLADAIRNTVCWVHELHDRDLVMERINNAYGNTNFTDVVLNIPIVILALLLGDGDFAKTVCTAANCGNDTDCTAATVGAIFGILHPDRIPDEWMHPIGNRILLSSYIVGLDAPETIEDLTDMVCSLRRRVTLTNDTDSINCPNFLPGRVVWRKSYIKWKDFRLDNFASDDECEMETFGWCGSTTLPEMGRAGILVLKTYFALDYSRKVRIMFNCDTWMRGFVNGVQRFSRDSGTYLMPASHRTAFNQYCDIELDAGIHELSVQLMRTVEKQDLVHFYFGIADLSSLLWIHNVFKNHG